MFPESSLTGHWLTLIICIKSAKEMLGLKLEVRVPDFSASSFVVICILTIVPFSKQCAKLEAEIAMSQHENARLQQQCDYARLFHQYHVLEAEFTTNQHENARLHQEASANQG